MTSVLTRPVYPFRSVKRRRTASLEKVINDFYIDLCNTWATINAVVEQYSVGLGSAPPTVTVKTEERKVRVSNATAAPSPTANKALPVAAISPDKLYCDVMQPLQFDSFDFFVTNSDGGAVGGTPRFAVSYHFEKEVKKAGDQPYPNRMKRLVQEVATLTTSLPLSRSSSVFLRHHSDRLDMMKVLITGPDDTPYANGLFEFDIYFPPEYPQTPMNVHLATTGRGKVRFNPNLYNCGKVCLSVLNTWQGRPEEKWNPKTSTLLQVAVSIQSFIFVSDPYFNEPGLEGLIGTAQGNQETRSYNANIRQATVQWALLDQIRNPAPCFKDVIHAHFWLKRQEIERQCDKWIAEMEQQVTADRSASRTLSAGLTALKVAFCFLFSQFWMRMMHIIFVFLLNRATVASSRLNWPA